jgi:hypothetical protein
MFSFLPLQDSFVLQPDGVSSQQSMEKGLTNFLACLGVTLRRGSERLIEFFSINVARPSRSSQLFEQHLYGIVIGYGKLVSVF